MKPVAAAGSVHVSLVNDQQELLSDYEALSEEATTDLDQSLGSTALVEEYIDGPEFSAEGYVQDSVVSVVSITEKLLSPLPYFIELGHTIPAQEFSTSAQLQDVSAWVKEVVAALGVDNSIFHLEFRVKNNKYYAIELAARMPGDRIADLILRGLNIDLAEVFINIALGQPVPPFELTAEKFNKVQAIRFPYITKPTYIPPKKQLISGVDKSSYEEFDAFYPEGKNLSPSNDFRSRYAYFIFEGEDRESVEKKWETVHNKIQKNLLRI